MKASLRIAAFLAAQGAIFMLCRGATAPKLTTLTSFAGTKTGAFPESGLTQGNKGVLYGTTYTGGPSGWGVLYQLIPPTPPATAWTESVLYKFTGGADGAGPIGSLVANSNSVLYGATEQGGAFGYGAVYSLTPQGGGVWNQTVLYSFGAQAGDGANPQAGLLLETASGVLYGTTVAGGASGFGTVFALTPPASKGALWTESPIYSFAGAPSGCGTSPACDGASPQAALTFGSNNGILYGTTYAGGPAGWGTVFQLTKSGSTWSEGVLYNFTGSPPSCGTTGNPACDGGAPAGSVVPGPNGVLYGTTSFGGNAACSVGGYKEGCGTVFQLTPPVPPATNWTETALYIFKGAPKDGAHPTQNLVLGANGSLTGTTLSGGSNATVCFPASYEGCGIIYALKPPATSGAWTKNTLAVFNGDNGGGPNGLFSPTSGVFYGTTYDGGLHGGYGTTFQLKFQ